MSIGTRILAGVGAAAAGTGGAVAAPAGMPSPQEYALNNPAPAIHATYEPPAHDNTWGLIGEVGKDTQETIKAFTEAKKDADEIEQYVERANLANSQEYGDRPPDEQAQTEQSAEPQQNNEIDTSQSADNEQSQSPDNEVDTSQSADNEQSQNQANEVDRSQSAENEQSQSQGNDFDMSQSADNEQSQSQGNDFDTSQSAGSGQNYDNSMGY